MYELTVEKEWNQGISNQRNSAATNAKESITKSILNASIRKSSNSISAHAVAKNSLAMENHIESFAQEHVLQEADL